uniref:Uncharacterized protein n=1 Tax=viral metagenome TaxID=1070528 RepID=A0A2V0RIU0_9ZZZZ
MTNSSQPCDPSSRSWLQLLCQLWHSCWEHPPSRHGTRNTSLSEPLLPRSQMSGRRQASPETCGHSSTMSAPVVPPSARSMQRQPKLSLKSTTLRSALQTRSVTTPSSTAPLPSWTFSNLTSTASHSAPRPSLQGQRTKSSARSSLRRPSPVPARRNSPSSTPQAPHSRRVSGLPLPRPRALASRASLTVPSSVVPLPGSSIFTQSQECATFGGCIEESFSSVNGSRIQTKKQTACLGISSGVKLSSTWMRQGGSGRGWIRKTHGLVARKRLGDYDIPPLRPETGRSQSVCQHSNSFSFTFTPAQLSALQRGWMEEGSRLTKLKQSSTAAALSIPTIKLSNNLKDIPIHTIYTTASGLSRGPSLATVKEPLLLTRTDELPPTPISGSPTSTATCPSSPRSVSTLDCISSDALTSSTECDPPPHPRPRTYPGRMPTSISRTPTLPMTHPAPLYFQGKKPILPTLKVPSVTPPVTPALKQPSTKQSSIIPEIWDCDEYWTTYDGGKSARLKLTAQLAAESAYRGSVPAVDSARNPLNDWQDMSSL